MDRKQLLSPHFTLGELTYTEQRQLDNTPSEEIIKRLEIFCVNYLEPLRDKFGPIKVNSGYRSKAVNEKIGGSLTSAHVDGCAADVDPLRNGVTHQEMMNWIIDESGMAYDQVILESSKNSDWIHLGMKQPNREAPRIQALRFKDGTYTKYDKKINYGL